MNSISKIAFCLLLVCGSLSLFAQRLSDSHQNLVDSLNTIINDPGSNDAELSIAYVGLSEILYLTNIDTVVPLCLKARELGEKALLQHPDAETQQRLLKYMADAINNLGFISERKGEIEASLKYYHESLKIKEQISDSLGMSTAYNNIALLHQGQESYDVALNYFKKSLKLRQQIHHQWATAQSYNNLGLIYLKMGALELSITNYMKSLELREQIGDKNGIAQTSNNIGLFYFQQDSIHLAAQYYQKSLAILEEIQNKEGMAYVYHNLATIELKKENETGLTEALRYANLSMKVSKEIGFPVNIQNTALLLSTIYEKQNKGMKALEMHKLYTEMKDSILNDENQKATAMAEAQYEYEKKKVIDDLRNEKQIEIEKSKQKLQFTILMIVIIGALSILILLIIIYRRLKLTHLQKNIIEEQKEEVEAQRDEIETQKDKLENTHKEITDSIMYAKRIQNAILPTSSLVTTLLPDSFILYKPKDVVAGDFYWLEKVSALVAGSANSNEEIPQQAQNNSIILFAAADCTGHGVPGAMVSVICHNAMNRAVREFGLEDPGKILDKTREIVVKEFEKSDEDVKDGMDIALCHLNGNQLQYAGAHNPLWIVRSTDDTMFEFIEIKGDKQPIGKFQHAQPFTTHQITLQKGDTIYLFSDGFADQFGGAQDKKFGTRKLKELLLSMQNRPLSQQKEILDNTLTVWMKEAKAEQLDDICIFSVKIT